VDPEDDEADQSDYYLEMQKAQGANGFFDDGFTFIFTETDPETEKVDLKPIKPRHISFQIYTSD
jgi:hypothetical protein